MDGYHFGYKQKIPGKKHLGKIPTVPWGEGEGQDGYAVDVMSLRGQFCGLIAYRQEQKIPRQRADYSL
jgi:hypothetical protein